MRDCISIGKNAVCELSYSYTFNGKEKDNEDGLQDYGMRMYDGRLGRFLSVDPVSQVFPYWTPYQFAGNMPIWAIDMDGLQPMTRRGNFVYTTTTVSGKTFNVRFDINKPQQLEIKQGRSYTPFLFTNASGAELDMMKGGQTTLRTTSPDYRTFAGTQFNGVNATDIVNQVLIDHPELTLVVVGNDGVPITDPAHPELTGPGYIFSSTDTRPVVADPTVNNPNEDAFDLARAQTLASQFFTATNVQTIARRDVADGTHPNVILQAPGTDNRGMTMYFDYSRINIPDDDKKKKVPKEQHGDVRIFN